ncbi:uncharacterized protein isoform X1 [Salmo salar]|uniref:Uncharacterized protein LOC106575731 isoform X1 n=1 Tax=Salmo salar TaxID=8030 RepID=A0ABM3D8P8_SALSA|nr:uncharacterized protein LOC106575731 isoform X1 [Salmo salar]XP_045555181.1 uncharacterized protein LOC106575731 isoform X1 [Salmo salar]
METPTQSPSTEHSSPTGKTPNPLPPARCYVCVSCLCVPGVTFVCLVYVFQVLRLCVLSMCSRCYVCVSRLCVPGVTFVSCLCVPGVTFVCLVYVFQVLRLCVSSMCSWCYVCVSCLCVPGVTFVCLVYVFQVLRLCVSSMCSRCYVCVSRLCVPGVTFVCLVYVFQVLRLCVSSMCSRCYVCVSCLCVPGVTFVCLVYVFLVLEFAEQRYQQKMNVSVPDSQLDAIGCLPMAIPFVLLSATANEDQAVSAAVEFVRLTHPKVEKYVTLYARALHATLNGECLKQQAGAALKSPELDAWDTCKPYIQKAARFPTSSAEGLKVHQSAVEMLGNACYTQGALSSMFYLAHKFHSDPHGGILANTNCGGENCNRGFALGALLGARAGYTVDLYPRSGRMD